MNSELLSKLLCIKCGNSRLQEKADLLACSACGCKIPLEQGIPDFLYPQSGLKDQASSGPVYESCVSQIETYRLKRIDAPLLACASGEVLEIGCGTCRLGPLVEKRQGKFFGLDPEMAYLLYAQKERGFQTLVCAKGERLPFRDGSFDSIISGYYAYRNVSPGLGLPEARRVLKKGGRFAFDLLNHWIVKLKQLKMRMKGELKVPYPFSWQPALEAFEFVSFSGIKQKARSAGFMLESIATTPFVPFLAALNRRLSNFYYRAWPFVYLGYDAIIVLKAV